MRMQFLRQHRKKVRNQKAQFSEFITEFERKRYQENDVLEGNIMNVIDRYTLSSNYSFEQFSEISEPMEINAQYSEFISHLLIRVIENRTGKRYELTLFGVVLILAIVHYYHLNPPKIFFNEFLDQQRNNNYYNRVISNYKDKIPLIFAKWQILTDVFNGVDYLMANFEPVFYKEIRTPLISLPMNMGGVKEIYENTRGIAYHGYSKLTEIHKSGVSVLETSTEVDPSYYMSFIKDKLSNIELLLQTTDLQRFMGYIAKQNYSSIYQTGIVTAIENSFANEVSFLFYITLTTKANFLPQFRD